MATGLACPMPSRRRSRFLPGNAGDARIAARRDTDPMITVHHLNNSRSQRVRWLLEELALLYVTVAIM